MTDDIEQRSGGDRRIIGWLATFEVAGALAMLYTMGYLIMVGLLYFVEIPGPNKEPLLQLFGLMSAIQMALIAFYFGSSKNAETTQQLVAQSKERTDATMRDIVKDAVPAAPTKEKND